MAWRKLPVITNDKTEDQLINLDTITYFRHWIDEGTKEINGSLGHYINAKPVRIDMPLEKLENELVSPTT